MNTFVQKKTLSTVLVKGNLRVYITRIRFRLSRHYLTGLVLSDALSRRKVRAEFVPHVSTLLEEAPISLLAKAVEQVYVQRNVPREQIWKNMRQLAVEFMSTRLFWNAAG